jgi:hypothetical protein
MQGVKTAALEQNCVIMKRPACGRPAYDLLNPVAFPDPFWYHATAVIALHQ